jgi:hypothetical protein
MAAAGKGCLGGVERSGKNIRREADHALSGVQQEQEGCRRKRLSWRCGAKRQNKRYWRIWKVRENL